MSHCTLVNPACPDDLCQLVAGHPTDMHCLSTMAAPTALPGYPVAPVDTPENVLIDMGCAIQDAEDDAAGRGYGHAPTVLPPWAKRWVKTYLDGHRMTPDATPFEEWVTSV